MSSALGVKLNQGRGGGTTGEVTDPNNNRALSNCLQEQAKRGSYSSLDGGRSAVAILKVCPSHVSKWVDSCIAGGEPEDSCLQKMLILGQATLKLVGK